MLNGLTLRGINKKMNHLNQPKKSNNHGFTLIEILIYITMFSLIIGAVVGLAILATSQRQKNQVLNIVNLQGESVISIINQDIDNSSSITSPSLGNSATTLTLAMPTTAANPTVFSSYNDGSTTHLEISQGSPAVTTYLTNSHVILSNLNFSNKGLSSTPGSILYSFTLTYKTNSVLQEFNFQKNFYGSASLL
jgi:type II secretory pathway pseudopilin PulG